jgi:hypothetical protein
MGSRHGRATFSVLLLQVGRPSGGTSSLLARFWTWRATALLCPAAHSAEGYTTLMIFFSVPDVSCGHYVG